MRRRKNNGNNKKKIIIIISVVLILVIGIIVMVLLNNKKEVKIKKVDKIKSSWGNIYYTYLKDIKDNDYYDKAGLNKDIKDGEISFYDIDDNDSPIMAIKYEDDNKDYVNIYYINNKKVDVIVYKEPTDIDYYYNMVEDKYDYYTNTKKDNTNNYISIKDQIDNKLNKTNSDDIKTYTFKNEDKETVKDSDGKEISLTKFDETFIEIDTDDTDIDFSLDISDKKLKNIINNSVNNYKTDDKIITDEVENKVKKRQEEVKNIRTNIENIKKKKKEEERALQEKAEREKAAREKAIQDQKKNDSNSMLTQAQADDIVKKKYNLDSNMKTQENGYVTSFASYGLVTYQGDNQKYYYYSSFNILEDHSSYNGSFIVNAKTGKIRYVANISRTAPDNGVVPSSSEDQDIN